MLLFYVTFNDQKFKVCWTWYLFLLSNFLVIIGAAIYLVIYLKNFPNESGTKPADIFLNTWMYPTIFNSVSILVMLVFAFYEVGGDKRKKIDDSAWYPFEK